MKLLGALKNPQLKRRMPTMWHKIDLEKVPDTFDSRTNWPDCPSIGDIRDQGTNLKTVPTLVLIFQTCMTELCDPSLIQK